MKIKKSDLNLLIIVFGILIPVAVYFFAYRNFTEKTAILNAENASLQAEVDYLQDLADHKEQYIQDTESMQAMIDEIKTHFPAEYRPEDDIMYIINVENEQGAEIPVIAMSQANRIEVAIPEMETAATATPIGEGEGGAEVAEGDPLEEGEAAPVNDTTEVPTVDINLYTTSLSVNMKTSYQGLKDIIDRLNKDEYRKSIDSVSVSFDVETGLLGSSMVFSAYSLTGTDTEYTTPAVPGVFFGTSDIFNTGEKSAAVKAEKAAEAAAAESEATE